MSPSYTLQHTRSLVGKLDMDGLPTYLGTQEKEVTHRQDGCGTEDAKGHFQQAAAEHDEEDELLAEREVGLPHHRKRDRHQVEVGDGVHNHHEDGLEGGDGWLAAVWGNHQSADTQANRQAGWAAGRTVGIRRRLTAGVWVYLPLVMKWHALEEGDEQTRDIRQRHHHVRPLDQELHPVHAVPVFVFFQSAQAPHGAAKGHTYVKRA